MLFVSTCEQFNYNFIMSSACGRARVLPLPYTVHTLQNC